MGRAKRWGWGVGRGASGARNMNILIQAHTVTYSR